MGEPIQSRMEDVPGPVTARLLFIYCLIYIVGDLIVSRRKGPLTAAYSAHVMADSKHLGYVQEYNCGELIEFDAVLQRLRVTVFPTFRRTT